MINSITLHILVLVINVSTTLEGVSTRLGNSVYTEDTRFCPLGSDATVSYGYLDLRLRNNTDATLRFELIVEDERFVGRLYSDRPIEARDVAFEREDHDNGTRTARAIDVATGTVLSHSSYKISVK